MKFQSKPAEYRAMTEQRAHGATPRRCAETSSIINLNAAHEPAEQSFSGILRVRTGHGISAQYETVRLGANQTVQKHTTVSQRQHDIAGVEFFEGAACDLDDMARPQSGQHTFSMNPETHPRTQTFGDPQSVCDQS
jgi:hypothetical protein